MDIEAEGEVVVSRPEPSLQELRDVLVVRDVTAKFLNMRDTFNHAPPSPISSSGDDDVDPLVGSRGRRGRNELFDDDDDFDIESGRRRGRDVELYDLHEPEWKHILNQVKNDMSDIESKIVSLSEKHRVHTTHRMGKTTDEKQREKMEIEADTSEIQRLFGVCKANISRLDQSPDDDDDDDSQVSQPQHLQLMNNLKIKLITELNESYKHFRSAQRTYLQDLSSLKNKRRTSMDPTDADGDEYDDETNSQLDDMYSRLGGRGAFTEGQVEQIMLRQRRIIRHDKELRNILKSIMELQELFQDFQNLVIQQGTLLDRIDRHIERASENVKTGNKHLVKAEKAQKCGRLGYCLCFLCVAVLVAIIAVAIKFMVK